MTSTSTSIRPLTEDTIIRIVVASDIHLGFLERDEERGNDSFEAFEEILQTAKKLHADMLLLGGDLFHENKPSKTCLFKTITLLKKYCLGDRPISLKVVSAFGAPTETGTPTCSPGRPNWEDPNFNVALPIFTIHGNHDDPSGEGTGLSALDLLAAANLINYIGKTESVDSITVSPILITKGSTEPTKIALYGIGNIRDERLYRTYENKAVKMLKPSEDEGNWFNLLVVHQNRSAHSAKAFLTEKMIESFVDFVIWGHEHECLIDPTPSSVGSFYISQPGSSVAVALTEGEAKKKHIGLLEINRDKFKLKSIPLKTVRPFIIDSINLSEHLDPTTADSTAITRVIESKIEELINIAHPKPNDLLNDNEKHKMKHPLIRLKVEHSGFQLINQLRFGQKYLGRVANPGEMLIFTKKKKEKSISAVPTMLNSVDGKLGEEERAAGGLVEANGIEELISRQLLIEGGNGSNELQLIPAPELLLALDHFVKNKDKDAIANTVRKQLEEMQAVLRQDKDGSKTSNKESIRATSIAITAERTEIARAALIEKNKKSKVVSIIGASAGGSEESQSVDVDELLQRVKVIGDNEVPSEKKKRKRKSSASTSTTTNDDDNGYNDNDEENEKLEEKDDDDEPRAKKTKSTTTTPTPTATRKPRAKKATQQQEETKKKGRILPAIQTTSVNSQSQSSSSIAPAPLRSGRQLGTNSGGNKPALVVPKVIPPPADSDPFGKWKKH